MSSKAKAKVLDILLICWILFLLTITLVRNCYGIEITDEAFHISESISVMRGNIPYTYAMSCTPGFTFIMLPLVKLYSFLVPDLEGIFLFTLYSIMLSINIESFFATVLTSLSSNCTFFVSNILSS